ncbi:uncharacterized protein LOC129924395 [Biomphalaria glabrata]|uniref:Uncharacterized protein LOC129924395 n=1 Tax=Biomphalaria glabrata TaxID=6526 RepID=A0A9W2ZHX5_BIOGL|nr:uncharacterized protein LOC129924395 [Biomphalaria glabrata]
MFEDPVADVIIGNVDEAKKVHSINAVTRAMTNTSMTHSESPNNNTLLDLERYTTTCEDFKLEQEQDPSLRQPWSKANDNTLDVKRKGTASFLIKNGLLYREFQYQGQPDLIQQQLVVPLSKRKVVLEIAHSSPLAGHMSINKTKTRIFSNFFWPGADKDIKQFVRSCPVCQKARPPGKCGRAELGVMNVVTTPFAKIAIDIVGPLELTDRKNMYILTLVDMATRWPEAIPLPNVNTSTVIEALSNIFARIGFPEHILSDNGPQFKSELYEQVCRFFHIKVVKSTPYHPSSNGRVERLNGSLKNMLIKVAEKDPRNWDRFINATLFAYREIPNATTGVSPYEMVYGRKVRGPMSIIKNLFTNEFIERETRNVYEYLLDLKNRLGTTLRVALSNDTKHTKEYKKYYDKHSTKKIILEGDFVLVLKPHRQNKLSMYWDGPYKVERKNSNLNYTIRKGNKLKVYHINRLAKYHDRSDEVSENKQDQLITACIAAVINDAEEDQDGQKLDNGLENLPTFEVTENIGLQHVKINKELNDSQHNNIVQVIKQFQEIITDIPGKAKVKEFRIEVTSDKPINLKPYTVPIHMRENLDKEIENMLKFDIIEESESPYASPVVLIKKKDSSLRLCVDYRRLNAITRFDAEVIPDPEDLFVQVHKAKYFTKVDLTKGFWQLPIEESSRKYTAFKVPNGHFQFKYVPFGLANSPSFFNRTIRNVLQGLSNVIFYFDDILIYNDDWESHLMSVQQVMTRLRDYGLTVKPEKLELGFFKITFLGHVVGGGKMEPDPKNLERIMGLRPPTNKKEVRSILGIASYYSKFIPSFADIVFPLTQLLRKGTPTRVTWSPECDLALKKIQSCLSSSPILILPNPNKPFIIQTDASDKGIACCLLQQVDGILHPIKYLSRKLLPRERHYAIIERECLAIVWSVQRLDRYLCGTKFTIQCDHRPLSYLKSCKFQNNRICRWSLMLQNFNFDIVHIEGRNNFLADTLSRLT